jgi:glutathione S-transferase
MASPVRIVGSYLSPYVRKVLVALDRKGVAYEIDPIIPFLGTDAFSELSPVRRIPLLIDDALVLADSTVICEYLEERYPHPPLLPVGAARRARARWLEEFADTRMGEVFIWRLFNQRVIGRFVWREPADEGIVERALTREIPEILDYLAGELPERGFLFDEPSTADIAIASFFRNAELVGFAVERGRWPAVAAFVERVLALDSFARLRPLEDLLMRTPIPRHREALRDAGAPVSAETLGGLEPRRGVMSL